MKLELLSLFVLLNTSPSVLANEQDVLSYSKLSQTKEENKFFSDLISYKLSKMYSKSFFLIRSRVYSLLSSNELRLNKEDKIKLSDIASNLNLDLSIYSDSSFSTEEESVLTSVDESSLYLDVLNDPIFSESRVEILSDARINLDQLREAGFSESRVEILNSGKVSEGDLDLDILREAGLSESRIEILNSGRVVDLDILRNANLSSSRIEILIGGRTTLDLNNLRENELSEARVEILSTGRGSEVSIDIDLLRESGLSESRVEILSQYRALEEYSISDLLERERRNIDLILERSNSKQ